MGVVYIFLNCPEFRYMFAHNLLFTVLHTHMQPYTNTFEIVKERYYLFGFSFLQNIY